MLKHILAFILIVSVLSCAYSVISKVRAKVTEARIIKRLEQAGW